MAGPARFEVLNTLRPTSNSLSGLWIYLIYCFTTELGEIFSRAYKRSSIALNLLFITNYIILGYLPLFSN